MYTQDIKSIALFVEKVALASLTPPFRFISLLPSNGYVRKEFIKRDFRYKWAESMNKNIKTTLTHTVIVPESDILYLELPHDYTYDEHKDVAKLLLDTPHIWVMYAGDLADIVAEYYPNCYREGNLFSNTKAFSTSTPLTNNSESS